jgi:hypothetical protein
LKCRAGRRSACESHCPRLRTCILFFCPWFQCVLFGKALFHIQQAMEEHWRVFIYHRHHHIIQQRADVSFIQNAHGYPHDWAAVAIPSPAAAGSVAYAARLLLQIRGWIRGEKIQTSSGRDDVELAGPKVHRGLQIAWQQQRTSQQEEDRAHTTMNAAVSCKRGWHAPCGRAAPWPPGDPKQKRSKAQCVT